MKELYSNAKDCKEITQLLREKLKNKMELDFSLPTVPNGKYQCLPRNVYNSYDEYKKDEVAFAFKYCKDGFLRITVGNGISQQTIGHKLAVLSDFYEVLVERFGEPTLFYTTKDDEEKSISLQWSFANKEEDIQSFREGTVFDDAEVEELIIFGESNDKSSGYQLSDTTKKSNSRIVGLPFELVHLAEENIEDYVKYKKGKIMGYPEGSKIDGLPISTLESREKRLGLALKK